MKKTTSQIVAVEGWRFLIVLGAILFAILLFGCFRVAFLFFIGVLISIYYFRNLEKVPDERDAFLFLAPIDGVVKSIKATKDHCEMVITNRIIDEHVLRMPTQGSFEVVDKKVGICANLQGVLAPLANKIDLIIKSSSIKLDLQISFYDHIKDLVLYEDKKSAYLGERIGFFYGGEIVIVAPKDFEIMVVEGSFVVGGKSVLGFKRNSSGK